MIDHKTPKVGEVWRDDVGARYRIVDVDDPHWIYVKHHDTPKRAWTRQAANEIPRAWLDGWTRETAAP